MADIVILGAGLGGMPMAYEMKEKLRSGDTLTVISDSETFHFTPSNPWVAVDWRKPGQIKVELAPLLKKHGIGFIPVAATRVHAAENRVELADGRSVPYDYLVIATGPELAFDEVEGLGPGGYTHSICHVDHAVEAQTAWQRFVAEPGPVVVGAVQGASCYGPAYEFAFIMDTDLRRRRIRDQVPMTFVTAEPWIGHLGLGGVGDTKGLLESELRQRHIRWITNARVDRVEAGRMHVTELDEDGEVRKRHELPMSYSMMLPAFRGIRAVRGIEGLTNPRGFITIDRHQRNPRYPNVFAVGVCVAIPPVEQTPVPTGAPKTGFMIETMVSATAHNIRSLLDGHEPSWRASNNAICLADFGDSGVAFVAMPQIPPRNVNWASEGRWVHSAKVLFEKYFLRKVRRGVSEPIYEKYLMKMIGVDKVREQTG